MTICSAVTETSGCKHVLNVSLHPNGFCVWCVQYLSILFSFKLEVLKQVFPSMWQSCLCVFVISLSIPLGQKLRLEYDMLSLLMASKPGVWSNKPLSCWMIDLAPVTENRISILTAWGYKALSSFPSLWEPLPQGVFPNHPSKIMISLKWLFHISGFG